MKKLSYIVVYLLICCTLPVYGINPERSSVISDNQTYLRDIADNRVKETIALRSSESFKNQVDARYNGKSNTLYIIESFFDLKGESIVLPPRVELLFIKGRIENGGLEGKNTLVSSECDIIFRNVSFKGTWKANRPRPEWFGADGNDMNDDTYALKSLAKFSGYSLFDKNMVYYVNDYIFLKSNIEWNLNGSIIKLSQNKSFSLYISQAENVIIRNGSIEGYRIGPSDCLEYGITIDASNDIIVENVFFSLFSRDGIYVGYEWSDSNEESHKTENILIKDCVFDNVARNGVTISAGEDVEVSHCLFKNINTTYPKSGIDIEPESINKTKYLNLNNILIHDCSFEDCRLAISVYQSNCNYQCGNVYIKDIECNNSILYIENIKKDCGFNTFVSRASFVGCKEEGVRIVNPCIGVKTQLSKLHIKQIDSMSNPRKTSAIVLYANGERADLGGVKIDGLKVDDTSYEYMISISHNQDKTPGKLQNISLKHISKRKELNGNAILLAEEDVLDKESFKARKAIKKKTQFITD